MTNQSILNSLIKGIHNEKYLNRVIRRFFNFNIVIN